LSKEGKLTQNIECVHGLFPDLEPSESILASNLVHGANASSSDSDFV
jgi:hypothetical protein